MSSPDPVPPPPSDHRSASSASDPAAERVACPTCGDEVARYARRCRHCGERIDPSGDPDPVLAPRLLLAFGCGLVLLASVCVVGSIVATALWPNLLRAERLSNEREARAALRAIAAAQARFKEEDLDRDGKPDYADLLELGQQQLLTPLLASGIADGYQFEVAASRSAPAERWFATASPLAAGRTGEVSYATNHSGGLWERRERPIPLDLDRCEVPADATPVESD